MWIDYANNPWATITLEEGMQFPFSMIFYFFLSRGLRSVELQLILGSLKILWACSSQDLSGFQRRAFDIILVIFYASNNKFKIDN